MEKIDIFRDEIFQKNSRYTLIDNQKLRKFWKSWK